jgi:hypothetical protein
LIGTVVHVFPASNVTWAREKIVSFLPPFASW